MVDATSRLPQPIAQMPPWTFWTRSDQLDLPAEDAAAVDAGKIMNGTDDQMMRRYRAIEAARSRLVSMAPASMVLS
jgi:hypothetical protein